MSTFLKVIAGVLTAVILWLNVSKDNKGVSVLLSMAVCAMVIIVALSFFRPILEFINKIQILSNVNNELISIILKVVGIGLLSEFSSIICKDAGNESMSKSIQILSTIFIIWMSIPVFDILLALLDDILGTI